MVVDEVEGGESVGHATHSVGLWAPRLWRRWSYAVAIWWQKPVPSSMTLDARRVTAREACR